MTYHFHPAAEAEHLEAVAYYESRRFGLGAIYLSEFESVLRRICEGPRRYPVALQPNIRRAGMRKFPFAVMFKEVSGQVQVLAVAHNRRQPQYWLYRLASA